MTDRKNNYGKFVWHDLMTAEPQQSLEFYDALFPEWSFEEFDEGGGLVFHRITVHGQPIGGLESVQPEGDGLAHWIGYIATPDIDAAVHRAEEFAGKVIVKPFAGKKGRFATLADPQGAMFKVIESGYPEAAFERVEPGQFCWDELLAKHIDDARHFYNKLFHWQHQEVEYGGEIGAYTLFSRGDQDFAGGLNHPAGPDAPSLWSCYIAVENVDERLQRAESLGATRCMEPLDVPHVGRVCMLRDPLGAVFNLFRGLDE